MKKNIISTLFEGVLKVVRKILSWEPFYNVFRKRASRKALVEYTMQKGAIELDGSGYHVLKLERPEGLSKNGFNILVDNTLICTIDNTTGRVSFTENCIKNNYELVEQVRRILRNLSRGGLKLNDSFNQYFEEKEAADSRYDCNYESNISTHLSAVGWSILK